MSTPAITEGFAPLDVPSAGKPCQTYYKIFGTLSSDRVPIIVINGGPGASHEYMLSLADLAARAPVVFYDQVGSGAATHLPEKIGDTAFWTVQLFVDEFHNLVRHLKLEAYDVVGHSWGAMLAMEIAVRQPEGLRKLVVASGPASIGLWVETARKWLKTLPQEIQVSACEQRIAKHMLTVLTGQDRETRECRDLRLARVSGSDRLLQQAVHAPSGSLASRSYQELPRD